MSLSGTIADSVYIAGFSPPTSTASQGVPVGLELMGRVGWDEELLDLAERIEGILQKRRVPNMEWI
jgi:Asp-tRNA(Asn)/Glu-tRNA(Gln) amidotransferase A subunit family amidase